MEPPLPEVPTNPVRTSPLMKIKASPDARPLVAASKSLARLRPWLMRKERKAYNSHLCTTIFIRQRMLSRR